MPIAISPVSTSAQPLARLSAFARTVPGRIVVALAATVVVALAAHISIPLWFTPVPLTLQPLAVLGVGLVLGPVEGFFAMLAYLAEGAAGLPVFSPTPGPGGIAQILGPTGGFLMSYPLVAFVAGAVVRSLRRLPRFAAAAIACSAAVALLFTAGAAWLMTEAHVSFNAAFTAAVLPFLPGEAVKVLVASGLYSAGRRRS